MADGYYFCIEPPTTNPLLRGDHDGRCILHVKFHGTGRKDYEADYEKLESTLLTEFLKENAGDNYYEMLLKLTFNITAMQDANAFCERVLERGIFCRQGPYYFLGHSETQLKEKSCYVMKASHEEIHQLLARFGDFVAERDVGKRARKIGMLFSPLNKTRPLDISKYTIEPDINRGFFRSCTFSNGCGFMSPEFSTKLQEMLKIDYRPSVVKVRYQGIEGLLALKEDLTGVKVQFHQSMQKFATLDEDIRKSLSIVDVVDYSHPYENGYLDPQMIMLLADRGVPEENLLELQLRYYELVEGICKETATLFLLFKGEFDLICEIQDKGIDDGRVKKRLKSFRDQELNNMKKAAGETRILVPSSRVVFAVCDPYNRLKAGECYFSPTMSEDEAKSFPGANQKVVVIRKPCRHPRDVQMLKLTVEKEGYESLRDCLVLPTKGSRPYALDFVGGPSDANKFFVSWSETLFPKVTGRPFGYPSKKAPGIRKSLAYVTSMITNSTSRNNPRQRNAECRKEMVQYFASFTDDLTGKIDEVYMKYAVVFGPSSKECRKLSKMFYQAVNLIEDRVVLEKQLLQLKEKLSNDSARSPSRNEGTMQRALRLLMCQSRRPCNPGNQVREEIEEGAKEFVERKQREFRKIIA